MVLRDELLLAALPRKKYLRAQELAMKGSLPHGVSEIKSGGFLADGLGEFNTTARSEEQAKTFAIALLLTGRKRSYWVPEKVFTKEKDRRFISFIENLSPGIWEEAYSQAEDEYKHKRKPETGISWARTGKPRLTVGFGRKKMGFNLCDGRDELMARALANVALKQFQRQGDMKRNTAFSDTTEATPARPNR